MLRNIIKPFSISALLLLLGSTSTHAEKITVGIGDEVCVGGYIMDTFCIELGVLFDNSAIRTLGPDGPSSHSVHCLVDVQRCRQSPYEVLSELEDGTFGRAWRVDDNQLLLDHAMTNGICTECDPDNSLDQGHLERGYQATIVGTVQSLGDGNTPAVISVSSVSDFNDFGSLCEGKEFEIPTMVVEEVLGGGGRNLVRIYTIHGILMIVGWGLLLPSGILMAKFGKHRANAWWFKMHMAFQPIGLLVSVIGWIIALVNFTTLDGGPGVSFTHAVAGSVTMGLSLLQAVNGIFRPHNPSGDEKKSTRRVIWEYAHRGVGWIALILSIITIAIGTTLIPSKRDQKLFQIVYAIVIVGISIIIPSILLIEKEKETSMKDVGDGDSDEKA